MWFEPTAPHITTDEILREEELVLTWAMDAQADEPDPSTTVATAGLDALQADAAAAVAGGDQLVLVVGPAGTGKTTTLRAAVDDLQQHGRAVFGVAPSAKAARVLERETGISCDTLAKLLHEWHRGDRPPGTRHQLPAGTTVLVDESGMVSTPALARLTTLAAEQGWRLALVGDPHQLQAVGRGGLFHELCVTGRAYELQRIHRFSAEWEAAASLRLRHGDPRGWDAYIEHGRVRPGTFDEHLATAADRWITTTAGGGTAAIVAATNEHVDALNAAIQRARVDLGRLDPATRAAIGGEQAVIGDHVVTRRNERRTTTSIGEPIRNREAWTVTGLGVDGSLTVISSRGHGTAVLPADYAREHVRLGYAATEHGVQGDTTTVGVELVSAATTRRGAYVGLTRGRDDNIVLVVTESHDLDEARDLLDRIITFDRADVPATTQRRELAAADRAPHRPAPRCDVPDWFDALRASVRRDLAQAERAEARAESARARRAAELAAVNEQIARAERAVDPYRPALAAADADVDNARRRWHAANNEAHQTKGRRRRAAQRDGDVAKRDLDEALARQAEVEAAAAPERAAVAEARKQLRDLQTSIRSDDVFDRWSSPDQQSAQLRKLSTALDDWRRWANGHHLPDQRLAATMTALSSASHPGCDVLANSLAPMVPAPKIEPPAIDLGISL